MATPQKKHTWKFYRIGALDQVAIETADDLLNPVSYTHLTLPTIYPV